MSANEFSRFVQIRNLPVQPLDLEANAAECAALADRFDLVAVESLSARIALEADGQAVRANGTLTASIVQECAVSGEDLPIAIEEDFSLRFVPAGPADRSADEVIELEAADLDEIEYDGEAIDLGEAIAQSLGLAIYPYAAGPEAEQVRREKGLTGDDKPTGPFAALAALKKT